MFVLIIYIYTLYLFGALHDYLMGINWSESFAIVYNPEQFGEPVIESLFVIYDKGI